MNKKTLNSFSAIQSIISFLLLILSAVDTSKESRFFLYYSAQKTALLLFQCLIFFFFFTLFLLKNKKINRIILKTFQKILENNLLKSTLLFFTSISVIAILIIQAFNTSLPFWYIYQKLFYLILNLILIALHLSFILYKTKKSTLSKQNFLNKIIIIFSGLLSGIYLYFQTYQYYQQLFSISPIIVLVLSLIIYSKIELYTKFFNLSKKITAIIPVIFILLSALPLLKQIHLSAKFIHIYLLVFLTVSIISVLFSIFTAIKILFLKTKIIQPKLLKRSFFIGSLILTTLNFYLNPLEIANPTIFTDFQRGSDILIIGKIINHQKDLIKNPFMGTYVPPERIDLDIGYPDVKTNEGIYFSDGEISQYAYKPYTAQIGIQGSFFSFLSNFAFQNNPTAQLGFFKFIMAFLLSLMLTFILNWILTEFGFFPAFFTFVGINLSQWLIIGAHSIYWNYWIFFLPLVIYFYYFRWEEKTNKSNPKFLYALTFVSIFLKSAMGFEFITTLMIMMTMPLFYFSFKNSQSIKSTIKRLIAIIIVSLASFISTIALTLMKIAHFTKNINLAFEDLTNRITKRTGIGNTTSIADIYHKSLTATYSEVLKTYFFENRPLIFNLRAIHLVAIFLIVILLSLILKKIIRKNKKYNALLFITGLSLLAPLSWFILAKAHSYIHTHINYILFSMPFSIFVFASVGALFQLLINHFIKKPNLPSASSPTPHQSQS